MEGVLEYIKQSYGNPPVYILENGLLSLSLSLSLYFSRSLFLLFFSAQLSCQCKQIGKPMKQDLQLQQEDTPRIEFVHAYMGAVLKAVR